MKLRTTLPGLAIAAVVLLGACGDSGSPSTATTAAASSDSSTPSTAATAAANGARIVVKDFSFTTKQVTVKAGESVTWTNQDAFLHTVTSGKVDGPMNIPDGMFDHPLPGNGGTATVTFEKPGTFTYYCKQHNAMNGTITVTA